MPTEFYFKIHNLGFFFLLFYDYYNFHSGLSSFMVLETQNY